MALEIYDEADGDVMQVMLMMMVAVVMMTMMMMTMKMMKVCFLNMLRSIISKRATARSPANPARERTYAATAGSMATAGSISLTGVDITGQEWNPRRPH